MPDIEFKAGKRPAQPARPHLRMSFADLGPRLAAPPVSVDWWSAVDGWPMYGNDRYGDCVEAAIGHEIEQKTRYSTGTTIKVTDDDVLHLYSAVTGFNPNDPATDQGTYIQDALTFWRKNGVGGKHQTVMYAAVTASDQTEVKQAINLLGDLHVGFNFPASAMTQFNNGDPWEVVPGSPIEGGHAVTAVGYDPRWVYVVTWGTVQKMSWQFFARYVDEVWVILTREWINDEHRMSPTGIDLYALGQAFSQITGEPNPIPVPDPGPAPVPTPVPDPDPDDPDDPDPEPVPPPVPVPAPPLPTPTPIFAPDLDVQLWASLKEWANHRHYGGNARAARAVRDWAATWYLRRP